MLKSDAVLRLSKEFGDSQTDVDATNLFRNWIDDRYLTLQSHFAWLHNQAFIDLVVNRGDNPVNIGGNVRRIISIKDVDNDTEIIFKSRSDLLKNGFDLESEGRPYYWYYADFDEDTQSYSIQLVYKPDATYNLSIAADKLSVNRIEDNQHIPVPNELLVVLFDGVRADANKHEDLADLAVSYEGKFESGVALYKRYVEPNPAETVKTRQNSDLNFARGNRFNGLQIPRHIG